ncbi:MAG: DNA mismatch repair endonuclease MutL [Desulfatiglans sp.]|nr:DNA mismatch repair endonuclease MutL [Desulfatiglans sp.]
MGKIQKLSQNVANQIAAGEVIDRPASVVRELLDNSIDSGADRITIRIEDGGSGLIRVSDNGAGMDRDDLLLAIERHATSKISTASDIFTIKTLGFRGEALPSICSVSRVEITSRPSDQISALRLKAHAGVIESIEETGAPAGTTVDVRDLYFNTPARKKFLKTEKTEAGLITDTVSRIALPFKDIYIKLLDNSTGKAILNLPSSDSELNRLTALFGKDVAQTFMDARFAHDRFSIRAYLAPPELSRTRGDRMYLYVNNRNIRDKLVLSAITGGYGQRLMKGRYPQVALFIDIDPAFVDINVHPAKQEVRFEDGRLIYQAISSTIAKALGDQINPFRSSNDGYIERPATMSSTPIQADDRVQKNDAPAPVYQQVENTFKETLEVKESIPQHQQGLFNAQKSTYIPEEITEVIIPKREERSVFHEPYPVKPEIRQKNIGDNLTVIGQLKGTYLLFEERDGLLMIDQHAAHERIVYETLRAKYAAKKMESQNFLLSVDIELSNKDARILEEKLAQINNLGFEIEHFGGNSFLIRAVPAILVNTDWESFLKDLIPVLNEEDDLTNTKAMDKLLTVMACHGAIRAGQRMTEREINTLITQLQSIDLATNCPHGRPVYKKISYTELEKMFKRIV